MVEKLIAELAEQPASRELIAQAEALEWVLDHEDINVALGSYRIRDRIAELRAQAAAEQPAEPIPVVDGSKPYYVEMPDGVRRKYLPGAVEQPAEPQGEPVAWIEHHKGGDNLNWEPVNHLYAKATPLYARPDPRVAELEADLAAAQAERDAKDKQLASCYDRMCKAEAEAAALRVDAERFRELDRQHHRRGRVPYFVVSRYDPVFNEYKSVNDLSAAIDQARGEA